MPARDGLTCLRAGRSAGALRAPHRRIPRVARPETGISRLGDRLLTRARRKLARVMEQTDFLLPDGEHDLLRRIRLLAERAERTAHNRSNFVGPPPSQEHLDI